MGTACLTLISVALLGIATHIFVAAVRAPVPALARHYSRRAMRLEKAYKVLGSFLLLAFALAQTAYSVFSLLTVESLGGGLWGAF